MKLSFRYNQNRNQIEATPVEHYGIMSIYVMPVNGDWSKRTFFENIATFRFDHYYADFETINFLIEKIYGSLTKDEKAFYENYFREIRSDPSVGYFD